MFQFYAFGVVALVATAMCWALAVVLYRVGVPGSAARKLSLLLGIEGMTLISAGYIDFMLTPAVHAHPLYQRWFDAEFIVHTLGDCSMLALYPPFLAAALGTKLTRPFLDTRVRIGLAIGAALLFVATLTTPVKFGASMLYVALALVFWFAFAASVQAWYLAEGVARTRARWFAIAFGVRDILWGYVYLETTWQVWTGTMAEIPYDPTDPIMLYYALGTLLAVPLIAYGILRAHLFDIDLRIRWTIKQSTLAAAVVTIIYVLSEGASRLLSSNSAACRPVRAGLVVFLAPLQRLPSGSPAMRCRTRRTPGVRAFASCRSTKPRSARPGKAAKSRRGSARCSTVCATRSGFGDRRRDSGARS